MNGAVVCAVVISASDFARADKRPQHINAAAAAPMLATDETLGLAQRPMYELSPATMTVVETSPPAVEPVLVPLPPGVWAALTGLVGLATVAAWRKYRFRHE